MLDSERTENLSFCGSPIYIAPEILQKQNYSKKVDFYALGVLLYETITGQPPFYHKQSNEIKKMKVENEVTYPSNMNHKLKEIIEKCISKVMYTLSQNPADRIDDPIWYYRKIKNDFGIDIDVIKRDSISINVDFDIKTSVKIKAPAKHDQLFTDKSFSTPKEQELIKDMKPVEEIFFYRESVHSKMNTTSSMSIERLKNLGKIKLPPVNSINSN